MPLYSWILLKCRWWVIVAKCSLNSDSREVCQGRDGYSAQRNKRVCYHGGNYEVWAGIAETRAALPFDDQVRRQPRRRALQQRRILYNLALRLHTCSPSMSRCSVKQNDITLIFYILHLDTITQVFTHTKPGLALCRPPSLAPSMMYRGALPAPRDTHPKMPFIQAHLQRRNQN